MDPVPPFVITDDGGSKSSLLDIGNKCSHYPFHLMHVQVHVTCTLKSHVNAHHMEVKFRIVLYPLVLRRTDKVCERERIVKSFHFRQVQVCVVNVMIDGNEDLSFTGVHHCILLHVHRTAL